MMKKSTLLAALVFLAAGFVSAGTKPNLVFILADDMTYWDVGCYGGQAKTPAIDKLAAEGMRFTKCFQAAPVCSPTRQNIYTGLDPFNSGAYPQHSMVREGTQSVVHYLKALGYRVALAGKRHYNPKEVYPFEFLGDMRSSEPNFDEIEKFVGKMAEEKQPFCLFICSTNPHTPWDQGDRDFYFLDKIKVPPHYVDTPKARWQMRNYLAEVIAFDDEVARARELLEKNGLMDSTAFWVATEQGASMPFAKYTLYDMGIQSGLVVRLPKTVAPGATCDALVEYTDFLPTFIEIAGGQPPEKLDGLSLLPLLNGEKKEHKEQVFSEMTSRGIGNDHYGIRAVRTKKFKYIRNLSPEEKVVVGTKCGITKSWHEIADTNPQAKALLDRLYHRPGEELYDIVKDPYETRNLAKDPEYAAVIKDFSSRLEEHMRRVGDEGQASEMRALEFMYHIPKDPRKSTEKP